MMTNLQKEIQQVFKKFPEYWEGETLLKNKAIEDIREYKPNLLVALLENETIKETYSVEINGNFIFKNEEFISMLRYKNYLENSYTKYSNKIGLTSEDKYLNYSSDVVLDFPHKDGVLEGGMTQEDLGKEEVFYHNILAKEEIDTLLSPKTFTNVKRYDNNGEHDIAEFTDKDNLIIKGNNLIALHTLKKRYKNRIKMIYIDPPYNTGNDSFKYNDSFNRSTWLTFMKNRLEVAKTLLRKDGSIFVQCDDNEQAYLKVLMDEIFKNGFKNCIAVKMSEVSGVKMAHAKQRFPKLKEYILFYTNSEFEEFERIDKYKTTEWDSENNIFLEKLTKSNRDILKKLENKEKCDIKDVEVANNILKNVNRKSLSTVLDEKRFENESDKTKWLFDNSYRIIKTAGSSSLSNRVKKLEKIPNQELASYVSKNGVLFFYITDFNRKVKQPRLQVIFSDQNIYKNPGDFWQDIKTTGAIANEGNVQLANGKKPEKIIHRLIEMTTNKGDIVLDFFNGSGTTSAVAHKMNRQYIGIEQLDQHNKKIVKRLKNVINGDKSGVSKEVGWESGGSFVYTELYELNQVYINEIQAATNQEAIEKVLEKIRESDFLNLKVDIKKVFSENKEFFELALNKQKSNLIQVLDNNQLYLSYSEIDDDQYAIDENTKAFNASFYEEEV